MCVHTTHTQWYLIYDKAGYTSMDDLVDVA